MENHSDIHIRPLEKGDESAVKKILHLADPLGKDHPAPELIWKRWGQYYFERCPMHCFVASDRADADDPAVGVIFCSPRSMYSLREFNKDYFPGLQKDLDRVERSVGADVFAAAGLGYYRLPEGRALFRARPVRGRLLLMKYPAHLHINVHPEYQGQGIGRRLVDGLVGQLRELGVPGLHLAVAADNTGGIAFYEAYGFKRIMTVGPAVEGSVVYALDLTQ